MSGIRRYGMTKILVSYGFGAGWATWAYGDDQKAIAEYKPIIDFLEAGGDRNDLNVETDYDEPSQYHPLVAQMMKDLDIDHFYTGGAEGLTVETVDGAYRINEYDGSESVFTTADMW